MPTPIDLRLDARWVLPIVPAGALPAHAVLIDGGRIVAVCPTAIADRDYVARETVSLPSHVLMPGLVNAHAHSGMSLLRGVADDVALKPWLEQHIWPLEGRFVGPDFVHDGTLLAAAEMLRAGITCCNDMYFFPDAAARAYRASGMRAVLGLPVLDFPTAYAADADACLQAGLAARDAWKNEARLGFSLAPHAPYTVGDESWGKIVMYARQLDLVIQTHVLEAGDERAQSVARFGIAPLQRLDRLGATGPGFIAIHGVQLDGADIDLLAAQHCHVVHCPTSNLKLANGIAPIDALLRHGVNVALGTDGAASNNRLDIFSEARLAALIAKTATGDAAAMSAPTVLHMATMGGAAALGMDEELGSLAKGKHADVIAVDLGELEHTPCYDPLSHLVHVTGREQVSDVWVAGERLLSERILTRIDARDLAGRIRFWQERMQ
jgi:5-methylthioadenosine/S-adenosylhomocysteine deaminase